MSNHWRKKNARKARPFGTWIGSLYTNHLDSMFGRGAAVGAAVQVLELLLACLPSNEVFGIVI